MFEIVISKKAFDMLLKAANMPKQIGDGSNADNAVKEFAKKILSETKAIDMTAKQRQLNGGAT